MNLVRAAAHFDRLREIAEKEGVQVYLLPGRDIDWKGLYVFDADLGPGIALNKELPIQWIAWILAHELGHYFAKQHRQLFSPFSSAIAAAISRRTEAPGRRNRDDDEHWADQWAARTLIDESEFIALENELLLDLHGIAAQLGLPSESVLAWEVGRRDLVVDAPPARIPADRATIRTLWTKSQGNGGHQSLFRRVVPTKAARQLHVSFRDFSLARARHLTVRGGWIEPYARLLDAVTPAIESAGGVTKYFRLPPLPSGAAFRPSQLSRAPGDYS